MPEPLHPHSLDRRSRKGMATMNSRNSRYASVSRRWWLVALVALLAAAGRPARAQVAPPLSTLYSFSATPGSYNPPNSDGAQPAAALVLSRDGSFYGTTYRG